MEGKGWVGKEREEMGRGWKGMEGKRYESEGGVYLV